MSKVEDETLNHVLPDLVKYLDLSVIFDKLLRERLIEAELHEHLASSLSSGLTGEAVRKTIIKIKRNPPGYLAKFIAVLKSEDKTKHLGDMIEQEYNARQLRYSTGGDGSPDLLKGGAHSS